MERQPQISIYLDTRRKKENGKYPVKLKVYTTKRKYYSSLMVIIKHYKFEKSQNILTKIINTSTQSSVNNSVLTKKQNPS